MIPAIVYTSDEQAMIDAFKALPFEKMKGYWDNTHEGDLTDLKDRIKGHYLDVQNYTCPYCRQQIEVKNKASWDAEHIVDKDSHPNFMFEAQNLCVACKDCNQAKLNHNVLVNKGRKTFPADSKDYLFCHPHFDEYDQNVKIISLAGFYLPKNGKGRKTVEICGLLRFLYKFAGYDAGSKEVDDKISALSTELMATNDGQIRHFLLSAISEIACEGAKMQMKQAMAERFKKTEPISA